MSWRTTAEADDDIRDVADYGVDTYGLDKALVYLDALRALFDLLAVHPYMARQRLEAEPPVRIMPFRAHHVLYREEDGDVVILRVLHGSRDWLGGTH